MQANELKKNFILFLFSIKQAYERSALSDADNVTLRELFKHGMLYRAILENENLDDAGVISKIAAFCKLIEDSLPPPEIVAGDVLHLELMKNKFNLVELILPANISEHADELYRAVIVDLMGVFQISILDLAAKLKSDTLSAGDVDNTNYVIGMAEITAINYGKILSREHDFGEFNCGKIQKFFADSIGFAGSLRAEGLGMSV